LLDGDRGDGIFLLPFLVTRWVATRHTGVCCPLIKSKIRDRTSVQGVDECDLERWSSQSRAQRERERERETNAFMYKNQPILFKNVFKNVSKNSHHLLFLYTRREKEKIKQTHAPVPAALELRRAVVAKVKAHYLLYYYVCAEVYSLK
jgi:endonuclease/exonuclease/phosphatase family metal-dependent hydrolase